jgi:outer membrane protein W
MKKLCLLLLVALAAPPVFAQRGVELLLDVEGVRRTGNTEPSIGQQITPEFSNGWGAGAGLNVWLSDRLSIEAKASGFRSRLHVTTVGSDFVGHLDLGHAQVYPIMAVLQWHPMEHGMLRPYVGVGAAHVILKNVNEEIGSIGASGIEFSDPTGLLLDAGLRIHISNKWDAFGDVRYVPVETRGTTTFPGTNATVRLEVKPLIAGFGVAYRF